MSEQEAQDLITVHVKAANAPFLRWIAACSAGVCLTIAGATSHITSYMKDVKDNTHYIETEAKPAIKQMGEDRAVLVSKNILQPSFLTAKK